MITAVEAIQNYEAGLSQKPITVVEPAEYIGKCTNFRIANCFTDCCRGWFSPQVYDLLDVESDGAIYSRIGAVVGRGAALQLNALIAQRFDAFLAGIFCGSREAKECFGK